MEEAIPIPEEIRALIGELTGAAGPGTRFNVADRRVEYDAIVELLMRERTARVDPVEAHVAAGAIAAGCFGEQHLWRDMRLPDRATLRLLFETYFSPFAEQNYRDMRWKKYIYRRLCRWEGFHSCKAPSCSECPTYQECFSPED